MSGAAAPARVLRIAEASDMLGIPPSTLRRHCARAVADAVKIGGRWFVRRSWIDFVTASRENSQS